MKLETRYYRLEKLVKWEHVPEVNDMLLNGISPHIVSDWCKERGFSISHPKLYEYKAMLQTAITKKITIERLLGIGMPKRKPIILQALGIESSKNMVKNEMEVLDAIIQRGFLALSSSPTVKLQDAMRAIELKNKLTEGKHAGLTGYGLDHLREVEQAKFNAVMDTVLKYLPDERVEELQEAIAEAERKYYQEQAPELLEAYEKSMEDAFVDNGEQALEDRDFDTPDEDSHFPTF